MNAALAFGSWPRPTIFTHVWNTLGFSIVAKSVNYDIRVNTSIIGKKVLLTAQYLLSGCKNAIFLNNPEIKHFRTLSISCPQDETWIRNILHILRSCVFICLAKSIARKLIKLSRHQFLKKKENWYKNAYFIQRDFVRRKRLYLLRFGWIKTPENVKKRNMITAGRKKFLFNFISIRIGRARQKDIVSGQQSNNI